MGLGGMVSQLHTFVDYQAAGICDRDLDKKDRRSPGIGALSRAVSSHSYA